MWQISSFSVLLAGELSLDLQVLWHTWSQAFQGFVFSFSNPVFLGETSHVSLAHSFVSATKPQQGAVITGVVGKFMIEPPRDLDADAGSRSTGIVDWNW